MFTKIEPPHKVFVAPAGQKGLGVFASEAIAAGEVVEVAVARVVPLEVERCIAEKSPELFHYLFWWEGAGLEDAQSVFTFGFAPFYNHSRTPNLKLIHNFEENTVSFQAVRDILPSEELTFDYDTKLWFDEVSE